MEDYEAMDDDQLKVRFKELIDDLLDSFAVAPDHVDTSAAGAASRAIKAREVMRKRNLL